MTVAPYSRISTRSPVGRLAVTLELSSEIVTWGVGASGETGIAAGFLGRSMLLEFLDESILGFLFSGSFQVVW